MNSSFCKGFEKTAILGFAAKVGTKAAYSGLKGIGKVFSKYPLGATFGGMEVMNVASKTKDFTRARPTMTPPGF